MGLKDFQERKVARHILFSWPFLILTAILVLISFWGVLRNAFYYREIRANVSETEKKIAEYEESKRLFEEKLHALGTLEGLEKEARARFNLMKPGEEVVVFLDTDVARQTSGFRAEIASAWESVKKYFYGFFK